MVFGVVVNPMMLVAGGVVVFALIVFQLLVGLRKIHFKGKAHLLIHKRGAWVLLAVAGIHGFLGFVYAVGLRIG